MKSSVLIATTCALLLWTVVSRAATISVDVSNDLFEPPRVEANYGDKIVFENRSTIIHSIHVAGRVYRFGQKHFVHDVLIYPRQSYVFEVTKKLKPGTYNVGCGLHNRMRGTIVVHRPSNRPKLPREGERWKTMPE